MAGLKNCVFLALTATLVAGLQNVIRYEMDKLEKSEQSLIEAWWRDEVNTNLFLILPLQRFYM